MGFITPDGRRLRLPSSIPVMGPLRVAAVGYAYAELTTAPGLLLAPEDEITVRSNRRFSLRPAGYSRVFADQAGIPAGGLLPTSGTTLPPLVMLAEWDELRFDAVIMPVSFMPYAVAAARRTLRRVRALGSYRERPDSRLGL